MKDASLCQYKTLLFNEMISAVKDAKITDLWVRRIGLLQAYKRWRDGFASPFVLPVN